MPCENRAQSVGALRGFAVDTYGLRR